MTPVVVTAAAMVNGCGIGMRAIGAALREGRTGLRRNDFESRLARNLGAPSISDWSYDLGMWRHLDPARPEDSGQ